MIGAGVNRVILVGYLDRDPEQRTLQSGDFVTDFVVVTAEVWVDKVGGEERSREERHRVAIFNETLGKIARDYLRRGSWVYLCGGLRTRGWVDNAGCSTTRRKSCCRVLAAS